MTRGRIGRSGVLAEERGSARRTTKSSGQRARTTHSSWGHQREIFSKTDTQINQSYCLSEAILIDRPSLSLVLLIFIKNLLYLEFISIFRILAL